jgi:hypothetical protein
MQKGQLSMAGGDLFSTYGNNILKYRNFSNGGMHIMKHYINVTRFEVSIRPEKCNSFLFEETGMIKADSLQAFVFVQLGQRNIGFHQLQDQAFRVISGHTKIYQQLTPCMRN